MMTRFAANDEISSTEKLLDVIRGRTTPSSGSAGGFAVPPRPGGRISEGLLRILPSLKKRTTVGVEFGHNNRLILVKIFQLSESRYRLLDYRSIPFRPNESPGSLGFHDFLRSTVMEFCGSLRDVNLWTAISAGQIDLRQIRIPRLSRKEQFNAIYWTARKEMAFDEKENLFDFEIQGETTEDGIAKTKVMIYTAPREDVKKTKDLFSRSGLRLTGVTTTTFAVQNLFRTQWVPTPHLRTYANLYLSDTYSRISIFSEGNLILSREIKTGVDSLIMALVESFGEVERGPAEISLEPEPPSLEALEHRLDTLEVNWERARSMLFMPEGSDSCVVEAEGSAHPEEEQMVELARPALERLLRQVERTFEHYSRLTGGGPVERVFVSGVTNICPGIIRHIGRSLGINTVVMDPLNPREAFLTGIKPPGAACERIPYTTSLGLALSDSARTPNLLFTFRDKEEQSAVSRINRSILWVFIGIISILTGLYAWQDYNYHKKNSEIAQLEAELAQYTPPADKNTIVQWAARVKSRQQLLKKQVDDCLGVAVLSELSALTPSNVRLIGITADLTAVPKAGTKDAGPEKRKSVSKSLVIDGIVQGDNQSWEISLARFLMKLESSPIFTNIAVHSSTVETYQEVGEVLHFILKMGLV
jgi:Tfp pilus assembly PilM family ATPase